MQEWFRVKKMSTCPTRYCNGLRVARYRSVVMLIIRKVSKVIRMFLNGFHTYGNSKMNVWFFRSRSRFWEFWNMSRFCLHKFLEKSKWIISFKFKTNNIADILVESCKYCLKDNLTFLVWNGDFEFRIWFQANWHLPSIWERNRILTIARETFGNIHICQYIWMSTIAREIFDNVWKHLATFGNVWQYSYLSQYLDFVNCKGNIWRHLETFGYIWQRLAILIFVTIFGCWQLQGQYLATFCNILQNFATIFNIWQYLA